MCVERETGELLFLFVLMIDRGIMGLVPDPSSSVDVVGSLRRKDSIIFHTTEDLSASQA
ncbi:hypothetical protein RDI58_007874 [Solanum bulbocastanum]|uniref:Uncharacterized protein n=1 Tax=Solanum bulbocastanum TaxID=147425 RepID=A0AAN8U1G5_SOLBU